MVGDAGVLPGKTVSTDGTSQTNQVVIPTVAIGAPISFLTMSDRNVNQTLSTVILYIDEALDLPFIANGLDMVVQPDWLAKRGWWKA